VIVINFYHFKTQKVCVFVKKQEPLSLFSLSFLHIQKISLPFLLALSLSLSFSPFIFLYLSLSFYMSSVLSLSRALACSVDLLLWRSFSRPFAFALFFFLSLFFLFPSLSCSLICFFALALFLSFSPSNGMACGNEIVSRYGSDETSQPTTAFLRAGMYISANATPS